MPGEAPALELVGVGRRFGGVIAVQDVSLRVERGSVHGLIGPNGAGKTTLLNLSAGALRPSTGTIGLDGNEGVGPPATFAEAYALARKAGLHRTAHCCEDYLTPKEAPPTC